MSDCSQCCMLLFVLCKAGWNPDVQVILMSKQHVVSKSLTSRSLLLHQKVVQWIDGSYTGCEHHVRLRLGDSLVRFSWLY